MKTTKRLLIAAIVVLPLASCKNAGDVYAPEQEEEQTEQTVANTFDYHTTTNVQTSITYTSFPNDVKGSVYFEVYDEYPFESEDAFANLKSGIEPVFTGYTSARGTFSGTVNLPDYMTKAYIYTPNPLVTSLMTADVVDGAFTATDAGATTKAASRAAIGMTRASEGYSEAVTNDGWKTLLIGDNYDKTTGKLTSNFLSTNLHNSSLRLSTDDYSTILTTFNSYRENVSQSTDVGNIPTSYASEKDMLITGGSTNAQYAEIAITLVQSATWWTSTVGYYYYKDGEAPTSYNDLKNRAIVIVPNALSRNTDTKGTQDQCGMSPNTTVQLKYYGDYNAKTHKYAYEEQGKEGSNNFPVNTRIGFVLYTNAWSNKAHTSGVPNTRAATSKSCCVYGTGADNGKALTAVFGINNFVVISFEDDNLSNAGRYTDCIFTTKSSPIDALDVDKVESTTSDNTERIGVYAFEDLWPSAGDYDMNDVIIDVSRKQTSTVTNKTDNFNHKSTTYGYSSETFNITTHKNYATLNNHWVIRLKDVASSLTQDNILVTKDGIAAQATITKEGSDYLVQMESIDASKDHEYAISLVWSKTFANQDAFNKAFNQKTAIQVFANRPDENWEVHVPYEAPTTAMKTSSLFGTEDDKTITSTGNWYTRAGEYPFAFFLAGATHNDISPLLDSSNESTPIDELYPLFAGWATSNGENNKGWYKK